MSNAGSRSNHCSLPGKPPQRADGSSISTILTQPDEIDGAPTKTFDPLGNRPPRVKDLPREQVCKESTKPKQPRILSSTARGVFGVLCEHANNKKSMWPPFVPASASGWLAWPSVLTVAAMTGYSDRAVQMALSELETAGAIQCAYRSKGGAAQIVHGRRIPAKTSAYLITPNHVPGSIGQVHPTRGEANGYSWYLARSCYAPTAA